MLNDIGFRISISSSTNCISFQQKYNTLTTKCISSISNAITYLINCSSSKVIVYHKPNKSTINTPKYIQHTYLLSVIMIYYSVNIVGNPNSHLFAKSISKQTTPKRRKGVKHTPKVYQQVKQTTPSQTNTTHKLRSEYIKSISKVRNC